MRPAPFLLASIVALAGCTTVASLDAGREPVDAPASDARDAGRDAVDLDVPRDAFDMDAFDVDAFDMDAFDTDAFDTDAFDTDAFDMDASSDAPSLDAPTDAPSDAPLRDAPIVRGDELTSHPLQPPIAPFTECTVTTATDMISSSMHLTPCSSFDYPFLPPSAGPHFSIWANFGVYTAPVPWGFLVHSMEHGGVVLAYNCEVSADCDAVRTAFQSIIDGRGVDPLCRDQDWPNRIIVVPDPTLPVPIAAVAWRNVYTATCLDPDSLTAFVNGHYGMASESLCAPGVDRSATAWCP